MSQTPIRDTQEAAASTAWAAYTAAYRQLHEDNLAGKSTLEQARDLRRLHQEFEALFPDASKEASPPTTVESLTERIRSAHAMLRGVIGIGSFEKHHPDLDDLNATCALILDAHQLLGQALKEAEA